MNFNTRSQKVNNKDELILIVETDKLFNPRDKSMIQQVIESENETTYTNWYNAQTDFLKQNWQKKDKYYTWMIVDHKDTTTVVHKNGELQDENKLLKSQIKAQSDRSDFLEDCLAEMAAQVYNT